MGDFRVAGGIWGVKAKREVACWKGSVSFNGFPVYELILPLEIDEIGAVSITSEYFAEKLAFLLEGVDL